jgi:acyl dehydratase
MSYGRTFEEFQAGAVHKHWPGRTITEHDNVWHALLSMNQNPLYIDVHHSRALGHERLPVVPTLIFSLAVGMSVADTSGQTIANLGYDLVSFERPLYLGDSLYAESEVLEVRESKSKPDRGIVHLETRAYNQDGQRVLVLRRRFLAPRRDAGQREGI